MNNVQRVNNCIIYVFITEGQEEHETRELLGTNVKTMHTATHI
jgi:hypothetical protein